MTKFCDAIQRFLAARVRLAEAAEEVEEPVLTEEDVGVDEQHGDAQLQDDHDYYFGEVEDLEDAGVHGVHAYSVCVGRVQQEQPTPTAQPVSASEPMVLTEPEPEVGPPGAVADEDLDWTALPWTTPGAQRVWSVMTGGLGGKKKEEATGQKGEPSKKKKTDKRSKPP